jgi:putative membrane protein
MTHRALVSLVTAAALVSAACGGRMRPEVQAAGGAVDVASAGATTGRIASSIRSDAHVTGVLHEVNDGEIAAARLAQRKALSIAVRDFADRMILEHTRLDRQLRDLASYGGISITLPDSTLPRLQRDALAPLESTTGAAFDRAYVTQQLRAHERALTLVNAGYRLAENDQLRTMLATVARPLIQQHLEMADRLAREVGASR